YDGNDIMPIIRRLTDEEIQRFGVGPILPVDATIPLTGFLHTARTTQVQPIYIIRVHVICCADDNGDNSFANLATVSQWIEKSLDEANAIYAAQGAGIQFTFRHGDVELLKSTIVNQDFTVPAGTNMNKPKDQKPLSDDQIKALGVPHETQRNAVCLKYADRCVFLLCCGTNLSYDDVKKMWVVGPRTGYAYSWETKEFVNFPSKWGALHGPEVAHESGHYLHLWHTHGPGPKTIDEAAKNITDYVNQKASGDMARGLEVFDPDRDSGVNDTPPDPGPNFYA